MPIWSDNTVHDSNLPDREKALRDDLSTAALPSTSGKTDGAWLKLSGGVAVWTNTPAVAEGDLNLSDVTTANVSTSKHGFAPKAPNDATKYLDGTGAYSVPAGGGSGGLGLLTWNVAGTLTTQTGVAQLPIPKAATIGDITIRAATAPTGASIIVDVNKNGTTVFTTQANRPTIAAAGNVSGQKVPDVTSLSIGDYLTVDIDQVGSTIAGADLVVVLRFA